MEEREVREMKGEERRGVNELEAKRQKGGRELEDEGELMEESKVSHVSTCITFFYFPESFQ